MTAFAVTDIPSSITTYEQLMVWAGSMLADLYPSLAAIESGTTAVNVAQSTPLYVTATSTPQWRNVIRLSIPLSADWRTKTHPWLGAQELGQTAVPAGYKVA